MLTKSQITCMSEKLTVTGIKSWRGIPIFDPLLLLLYIIASINIARKYQINLIISTVPKINNAIAGCVIAKLFKIPHIIDIRDFWESSLFSYPLSAIIPRRLALLAVRITSFVYQDASSIITVNETLRTMLNQRGLAVNGIYIIPNGADSSLFKPCEDETCVRKLRGKYKLPLSKLIFVYGGALSLDYRFDAILKGLSYLREDGDFLFAIVCNPTLLVTKEKIMQTVRSLRLEKIVKVLGPLPVNEVAELFRCCDVGVIPLDDNELFKHVITAKIFAYLASGLPVLASGPKDGELEKFLAKYEVGIFVDKSTPRKFAQKFRKLIQNKNELKSKGREGRKVACEHYDRYALAKKIVPIMQQNVKKEYSSQERQDSSQ